MWVWVWAWVWAYLGREGESRQSRDEHPKNRLEVFCKLLGVFDKFAVGGGKDSMLCTQLHTRTFTYLILATPLHGGSKRKQPP